MELNLSSITFDSPRDWGEIGIQIGPKHVIYQKLANFM